MDPTYVKVNQNDFSSEMNNTYIIPHDDVSCNSYYYVPGYSYETKRLNHHQLSTSLSTLLPIPAEITMAPFNDISTAVSYGYQGLNTAPSYVIPSNYVIETNIIPQYSIYEPRINNINLINSNQTVVIMVPSQPEDFVYTTVQHSTHALLIEEDQESEAEFTKYNNEMDQNNYLRHNEDNKNTDYELLKTSENEKAKRNSSNVYRTEEGYLVEEPDDDNDSSNKEMCTYTV